MDKPFKFRRAREISGVFVLIAILLLMVGVMMHGKVKGWFEPKTVFEVELPTEGTLGIKVGSEVHILGSKVGTVTRIELRQKGHFEELKDYTSVPPGDIVLVAILEVRGGRSVFVGSASNAILKKDLAGFGSSYFDIMRDGTAWPEDVEVRSLKVEKTKDVTNELTSIVEEIRDSLIPALGKIEDASREISVLAKNLSSEGGGFQGTLAKLDSVMEKIDRGEGTVGAMISDKESEKNFTEMLANFNKASVDLTNSLAKIDGVVSEMDEGKGTIGRLLKDEKTAQHLDETMANLDKASKALDSSLKKFDETAESFPGVIEKWNSAIDGYDRAATTLQQALKEYELLALGAQQHPLLKKSVNKAKEKETGSPGTRKKHHPRFSKRKRWKTLLRTVIHRRSFSRCFRNSGRRIEYRTPDFRILTPDFFPLLPHLPVSEE